ncbi:MAG TPA: hypothetical protein VJZ05_01270 [Bacilli bacterium]|nr:hypothetical protein [Bacilli bacterium]
MKKMNLKTILLLLGSIVTGAAASIGFASAAFIYNQQYQVPVDFNVGRLSTYFEGGNGSETTPYLIATPDHLRNLQKLNVLGVFGKNTHFRLSSTIPTTGMVWSGENLMPIGSEDYPFFSQFDGNGKIINNLVVVGSQTNDVGMFGYTAINSQVYDFILSAPTIYVNAENNPNQLATTNPFDSILSTEATNLQITLTPRNGTAQAYFTVSATSVSANGVSYAIQWTSSDESLLVYDANTSRWNVNVPADAEDGAFYPVQLAATVYGLYQDMIVSYTLERWQINVTDAGDVNIADVSTDTNQGYWKTIHDIDNIGFGVHATYVGFFIGHLDGEARNLGLYGGSDNALANNAKLYVSGRQVQSYTTLIGRSVNDNVNDDANGEFTRRFFDYDALIRDSANLYPPLPEQLLPAVNEPALPTVSTGINTYYTNMQTYAQNLSSHYGVTTSEFSYLRYYPGLTDTSYINGANTQYALQVDDALAGYIVIQKKSSWIGTRYINTYSFLHNGIWIYMSTTNPGWSSLITNTRYEAKIRVSYVATGSNENKFQLLFNSYNPNPGSFLGIPLNYYSTNVFEDLSTELDDNNNPIYDPSAHSVILTDEFGSPLTGVVEQELSFVFDRDRFALSSGYHLVIGLGVGRTRLTPTYVASTSTDTTAMTRQTYDLNYTNFSLKILSLDLFFTSLDGTISRQINNVDYLYALPSFSDGSWTDWPISSGVRINFDVVTSAIYTSGQYANYRFYRSANQFFSGSTVYGIQNVTSNDWNLENTTNYSSATFSSETW